MAACGLAGTGTGAAQSTANKVGIINIQDAIIRTEEGQKTAKTLQEKYAPRQTELEKKKRELDDLQAQLAKGRNTMSEEARNSLIRQIDLKTKILTRDNEDATAEFQAEEQKQINAIGGKMLNVVEKFARQNGYSIILDISSPQSPVLFAINSVDITADIVALYDKANPVGGAAASGAAAPAPSGAITKPPATPPPATKPSVAVPKTTPPKPPSPTPKTP
jgi:outer membrane protein